MDYPEKEIYTELVARLKAKASYFTDAAHPVPAHYDMDRAQYLEANEKDEYPFERPAIFFMFGQMDFVDRGGISREGTVPLVITCVQDKFVDSHDSASNQADYLKLLEWKYLVNDILDLFRGTCFGPLNVVHIETDHNNRNLHVETISYEIKVRMMRNVVP